MDTFISIDSHCELKDLQSVQYILIFQFKGDIENLLIQYYNVLENRSFNKSHSPSKIRMKNKKACKQMQFLKHTLHVRYKKLKPLHISYNKLIPVTIDSVVFNRFIYTSHLLTIIVYASTIKNLPSYCKFTFLLVFL